MQPSDPTVDPDADPTRVRPERQAPADASVDSDAAPTTVRPRFSPTDPSGGYDEPTDLAPHAGFWGEPARAEPQADPMAFALGRTGGQQADGGEPADPGADPMAFAPVPTGWEQADDGGPADPDGGPTTVLTVAHDSGRRHRRRDWDWVEEWRAEKSAPAWGPGIAVGIFVALIVAVALIVLTSGVSDSPVLAIVFNVVIAAGMAPALWLCRSLPVLRFLAAGAAAGILFGWIAMLTTF